jgi:uncharacterized FAD-dependent dehydrogenase
MLRVHEVKLPLDHAEDALRLAVLERLGIQDPDLLALSVHRRGYDARKRSDIHWVYTVDASVRNEARLGPSAKRDPKIAPAPDMGFRLAASAKGYRGPRPVVLGMGPCGLFAALILAEMGFAPLVLERGKMVRERTKDTFAFWRKGVLNPASNAQFGEGGAGTFSDGKLYSRVKDPEFLGRKVLTEFVAAGAPDEILTVSKPHIGTFRLVSMVETMRAKIEALGGEIKFESQIVDLKIAGGAVAGVVLAGGTEIETSGLVLALGHSARDTFEMLHARGVYMEPKPFSVGVRIEHPQSVIDKARFGARAGHPLLGAADYQLAHHADGGRTAYSFCMCPGGTVVAAASEPGRLVTNGMSQYSRKERNANAGLVVDLVPDRDFPGHVLGGVAFQRHWEERAFAAGGGTFAAPGQLAGDFLAGRASKMLGDVIPSYKPGVALTDLRDCLPEYVVEPMRAAIRRFGRQIPGFDRPDAVLTGVETRTSSPVRLRRGADMQSLNCKGLYPAGEGAGYAGGILSAAIDGIKAAQALGAALAAGRG